MRTETDWVVCDGILWVRECGLQSEAFSPAGKDMGIVSSVTMRPATKEELIQYQELKTHAVDNTTT